METQKAVEALGEISLVTGSNFPSRCFRILAKSGVSEEVHMGEADRGRQIEQNGSCRTFGNIVVDVCQSDEIRFCKNVH